MSRAPSRRLALTVVATGVLLSSADAYVVVLALPAIMADVGISLDRLQEATPIISGFLLGYVVVMPLLGRLSDVQGRPPVLLACIALFAAGSLITASAQTLGQAVAGRAIQGMGGGGLVPLALAVVADMWTAERRGLPLGVVGGAQELGSVAGPLYGGLLLSLSGWRTIFWLNLPISAVLAAGVARTLPGTPAASHPSVRLRLAVAVTAAVAVVAGGLAIAAPAPLVDSVTWGVLYLPLGGVAGLTWLSVVAAASALGAVGLLAWRRRSIPGRRRSAPPAASVDWLGAGLLAASLACVVVVFAAADPARAALADSAVWLLPAACLCLAAFGIRQSRAPAPLIEPGALRSPAAFGAILVNLALGAALMATVLDVPVLARATVYPDSQFGAALVLLRLLAGVPVGALIGGWLCRRWGARSTAALGLALATGMLLLMSFWTAGTLAAPFGPGWLHPDDPVLVLGGLGFGLAVAPVSASILGAVPAALHGVASALVVVARVTGMLVGVSVLTTVGLHAYYTAAAALPSPITLCPASPLRCPAYDTLVTQAVVSELRTVFLGAALCAALATLLAVGLLARRRVAPAPVAVHG